MTRDVIVIGGGAAGMLAALTAAENGARVLLLERNQKVGRKLYITGKGRCNLTNDCPPETVLANTACNSRFLTSAVTRFPPGEVKKLFERLGVPLKTERGNRVFPQSDRAADVVDALFFALRRTGVEIAQEQAVRLLEAQGRCCGVRTQRGTLPAGAVILATGGLSYPATGSTGDGYRMAREVGHTVIGLRASLTALTAAGEDCARLQGLSLRNVGVKVKNSEGKVLFQEQGEMLFTHFGVSGPLILSASAHMRSFENEIYTVLIDLKPALDEQTLDRRLVRELGEKSNRTVRNVLEDLAPRKLAQVLAERCGLAPGRRANEITRAERRRLLEALKSFSVEITGPRPISEAIITAGGIKVGEVDPKTMASKKLEGLYFAGEILDVDAYTGGFNLQIAWSTGHAAGEAAAAAVEELC